MDHFTFEKRGEGASRGRGGLDDFAKKKKKEENIYIYIYIMLTVHTV